MYCVNFINIRQNFSLTLQIEKEKKENPRIFKALDSPGFPFSNFSQGPETTLERNTQFQF